MKTIPILPPNGDRSLSSMTFAPVCVGMVLCCFVEATPAQTPEAEAAAISSQGTESPPPDRKPRSKPSPSGTDATAIAPSNPSSAASTATASVTAGARRATAADTSSQARRGAKDSGETEEVMGLQTLGEITVSGGRANGLEGIATSASQGEVSNDDFKYRPLSRTGEVIEVVPGMLSTQHSGTGKANQYFLRGFNLDHGTDFTTWIDGIPMNLRTNAHGQGYMDLNSLIPEMVDRIEFGKGPYYADQGDFSSAGYARMTTKSRLTGFNNDSDKGYVLFEGGMFDYYRALLANSNRIGDGDLLYAGEVNFYNGPWVVPENGNKYNGMLKYTLGGQDWQVSLNGKAYYSHWTATNQIPLAQLGASLNPTCCDITGQEGNGTDGRFGSMNPSDGGVTSRYSGSLNATSQGQDYQNQLNLYALYYDLDLWSDFTYFSANPYQGDQVYQRERRVQAGGNAEQVWFHKLWDLDMENKLGVQLRYDGIRDLGVSNTWNKQPVADNTYMPPSLYDVDETSLWFYGQNETRWTRWLRSQAAARSDTFWFDVQSKTPGFQYNAENSGTTSATVLSPKFNLIFG
ncbi:MAG: TonB-dependent receptor, partial [Methylococcus sp.]